MGDITPKFSSRGRPVPSNRVGPAVTSGGFMPLMPYQNGFMGGQQGFGLGSTGNGLGGAGKIAGYYTGGGNGSYGPTVTGNYGGGNGNYGPGITGDYGGGNGAPVIYAPVNNRPPSKPKKSVHSRDFGPAVMQLAPTEKELAESKVYSATDVMRLALSKPAFAENMGIDASKLPKDQQEHVLGVIKAVETEQSGILQTIIDYGVAFFKFMANGFSDFNGMLASQRAERIAPEVQARLARDFPELDNVVSGIDDSGQPILKDGKKTGLLALKEQEGSNPAQLRHDVRASLGEVPSPKQEAQREEIFLAIVKNFKENPANLTDIKAFAEKRAQNKEHIGAEVNHFMEKNTALSSLIAYSIAKEPLLQQPGQYDFQAKGNQADIKKWVNQRLRAEYPSIKDAAEHAPAVAAPLEPPPLPRPPKAPLVPLRQQER